MMICLSQMTTNYLPLGIREIYMITSYVAHEAYLIE
jgi:hypothetical protein